jgi:hypothetical protein
MADTGCNESLEILLCVYSLLERPVGSAQPSSKI